MLHRDFVLKIWDLLRDPTRLDRVEFENVNLADVQWLDEGGYSGVLSLQGVTDGSIKVTIEEAQATINDVCDLSGESYQRQVEVEDFTVRFSDEEAQDDMRVYDEVFPLHPNSEVIDVYDLLVQSIVLQEPLVHIKPGKEYLLDEYEFSEKDLSDKKGNVRFFYDDDQ